LLEDEGGRRPFAASLLTLHNLYEAIREKKEAAVQSFQRK